MTTQSPKVEVLTPEAASPEAASPETQSNAAEPASGSRCQHRYQNGKRCRLPGSAPQLGLCPRHFRQRLASGRAAYDDFADLSADLLPNGADFSSAGDLREYLLRLLILMTEGRVSPRRASILAYVTTQLLHTHVAAEKEAGDNPQQIILDLPRPKRDDDISPERAFVNRMSDLHVRASKPIPPGTCDGWPPNPNPEQPK